MRILRSIDLNNNYSHDNRFWLTGSLPRLPKFSMQTPIPLFNDSPDMATDFTARSHALLGNPVSKLRLRELEPASWRFQGAISPNPACFRQDATGRIRNSGFGTASGSLGTAFPSWSMGTSASLQYNDQPDRCNSNDLEGRFT